MLKRGVFLGKKGQGEMEEEVYSTLIQVAILVFVLVSLGLYLKSVRDNTVFEKIYLSRDIALLMNSIYAAPENIGYVYAAGETNLTKFTFKSQENYVVVNDKNSISNQEMFYKYATDLSFHEEFPLIEESKILTFVKNDNTLKVGTEGTGKLNALICQDINTKSSNWKTKVIIDPGHGSDINKPDDPGDVGYSTDAVKESVFTTQVATALKSFGYMLTRDYNYYLPLRDRISAAKNSDVIISLHVGNYSQDKNIALAFVSAESLKKAESRKLACLILNIFMTQFNFESIAIVPVFHSELLPDDPKQILMQDKIAVFLEIENINNKASVKALKPSEIASAINDALNQYYG